MNNINIVFNNNLEQANDLKGQKLSSSNKINTVNITEDFFKSFIQTCVIAKWKYQIMARKYRKKNTRKPTKNDIFLSNTKKLFNSTVNIFSEHKINYLYELFDLMGQMPQKPGIKHDNNYGKIKIVNNKIMKIKAMKKIKFLSKLYFIIKINNDLEDILIDGINKMKDTRNKKL